MQKRTLYLRHRLHLVTTSHECAHVTREVPRTALQIMDEADAMAASPQHVESVQKDILDSSQRSVPAMEVQLYYLCCLLYSSFRLDCYMVPFLC